MIEPSGDPQHAGDALKERLIQAVFAGNFPRDLNIALGAQCGQQVELLENEANLLLAHRRALSIRKLGKVSAIDHHMARGCAREPAKNVKQSGLAASRWADNTDKLAFLHGKTYAAQSRHIDLADAVNLGDVLDRKSTRLNSITFLYLV